jgi:hypothetical protein
LYWFGRAAGTFLITAYYALPLWLGEQILWSVLTRSGASGVAYQAHIGGFVVGFGVAFAARALASRDESSHELPRAIVEQPQPRSSSETPPPPAIAPPPPAPPRDASDEPSFLK